MKKKLRVRSYLIAGFLGGAALFAAPAAGAQELPGDPAGLIEQVQGDLADLGISGPEVDAVATQATQAVEQASGQVAEVQEEISTQAPQLAEDATGYAGNIDGPNYHWREDTASKALAGSSTGPVLQRVAGSWFDAPDVPQESRDAEARGVSLYGPGTPVYVGDTMMCTLGVAGHDAAGRKIGLTAGHCGDQGDPVMSADSHGVGQSGTVVGGNKALDYSVVEFGDNAEVSNSYNGVTVNSVGGPAPATGEVLCKQGVATGHTCGNTWTASEQVSITQVCAMQGDSGAPVMRGDQVVGMVSGGLLPFHQLQCQSPLQGQLFMPTVVTNMSNVMADLNATGGPGAGFRVG